MFNYEQAIAEYVFMALLSLRRDLMRCDKSLRIGNWGTGDPVPDIAGSTLGVEEFGGIGRALIVPCRSFKMNIIGVTAQNSVGAPPEGVKFIGGLDSIGRILVESDVVVVAVPQTAQTIGLIGVCEVSMMKRSAVLINVGRGPVVDETALYDSLSSNRLAGAAIDVCYRYPQTHELGIPSNLPFHNLPNVVMTPNQAGAYEQRYARRRAILANNIDRISRREQPINVVWEPKAVLSNSRTSFAKKENSKNEGHKNTMDANRGS